MKHIVIDARIINSSTGRYIERLIHYLQEVDTVNQYTILVPAKDKDYWKPTGKNFRVKVADFDQYSLGEQIGLKRLLDKLQADLVHFCMPQQPVLYRGRTVTTFHDLTLLKTWNRDKNWFVFHTKQFIGRFVFWLAARKSTQIITPTKYTRKELLRFASVPSKRVTVTYEAADVDKKDTTQVKLPFKQFILYVGQQPSYKNIQALGDAHQKLLENHPGLGLVLAGRKRGGVLDNEKYFTRKGYKNIYFTDFVTDEQLGWLYEHTSAYVFPSLMEGFGLPGLEAMGYGAPVVSSNTTCLPEVYGDAAGYFDPYDTDNMVTVIDKVLSDKKLQKEMIARGYKKHDEYSWRRMAEQTHEVYMKAMR